MNMKQNGYLVIIQVVGQATNEEFMSRVRYHCGNHTCDMRV